MSYRLEITLRWAKLTYESLDWRSAQVILALGRSGSIAVSDLRKRPGVSKYLVVVTTAISKHGSTTSVAARGMWMFEKANMAI